MTKPSLSPQAVLLRDDGDETEQAKPPMLGDDRICLRPWRTDDAPALVEAWHDPEIAAWQPVPEQRDLAAATRWIDGWGLRWRRRTALDLVICDTSDSAVTAGPARDGALDSPVRGEVGLSAIDATRRAALVGWWLTDSSRGQGRAARAVHLLAHWAFTVGGLEALVAEIDAANERSRALAARCGFAPVADRTIHVLRAPMLSDRRRVSDRADKTGRIAASSEA